MYSKDYSSIIDNSLQEEIKLLSFITDYLEELDITYIDNNKNNSNTIDLHLPQYKLVINIYKSNYINIDYERNKKIYIDNILCNLLRFNPYDPDFNLPTCLAIITKYINYFSEKNNKKNILKSDVEYLRKTRLLELENISSIENTKQLEIEYKTKLEENRIKQMEHKIKLEEEQTKQYELRNNHIRLQIEMFKLTGKII
jgi:hypothetical protein